MNIAAARKSYYESKDFKDEYSYQLAETFANEESYIIEKILSLFNVSNYETEKELSNHLIINKEQAKKIYDFIYENIEDFTDNFSGHWVGYTSLESVEFGEQEEQLTGIHNNKTGKEYSLSYLQNAFTKEGYAINESNPNYAYYIVSGGLHVDLLKGKDLLNDFLLTIK